MLIRFQFFLFIFLCSGFIRGVKAQYTVNGNAFKESCNCYLLTPDQGDQSGSVWNNNKINLTQSFSFTYTVFLGCSDAGADGLAFVLQPISTSVGTSGGGMGVQGINPSLAVTLDTYQNSDPDNDPVYDHIAIQLSGDVIHSTPNTITPPTPISATSDNVEDCENHLLKVVWDAPAATMVVSFDGVQRLTITRDIINTVFGGNPEVFWGFTGATGGLSNLQRFCTSLIPGFGLLPTQTRCIGEPITFYDSSITFGGIIKYYWNFGDGSPLDSLNVNPTHVYFNAGDYNVSLTILAQDSCSSPLNRTVRVGSTPKAYFKTSANSANYCVGIPIQFIDSSYSTVGTINNWYWDLGNGQTATGANPAYTYNIGGDYLVKLIVGSLEGCVSDTFYKTIHIYSKPVVDFTFTDSVCLGMATNFYGTVLSSSDPITNWLWHFGDSGTTTGQGQNTLYSFLTAGVHNVLFGATSNESPGCMGLIYKPVFVVAKPFAAARQLPVACEGAPFQLLDSSYTVDGFPITNWWWDFGGGQVSRQQNPFFMYSTPGSKTIRLVVTNSRNCISDSVVITVNVGEKPSAKFGVGELLCSNSTVQFFDSSTVGNATINAWAWLNNSGLFSAQQNANGTFNAGVNTVGLTVRSNLGCQSDTVSRSFIVKTKPGIAMHFDDACKQAEVLFLAAETATSVGIAGWHWNFGDGTTAAGSPARHRYTRNGTFSVGLYGISTEGCTSDTLQDAITIFGTDAFAGNDIRVAENQPVQLNATGGLNYEWSPATGLSATNIFNPVAINTFDRTYYLRAFTPGGCESFDTINIKVYKGPEIYVPGAFTPNADGTNDVLSAIPIGITRFDFFTVYNRYGQVVFTTTDYNKGWDGRVKGTEQNTSTYAWVVSATDFTGKKIFRKGTVLLIR